MTDQACAAAQADGDDSRCPEPETGRGHAWRLVLGALGLVFVCLALAGTFIP